MDDWSGQRIVGYLLTGHKLTPFASLGGEHTSNHAALHLFILSLTLGRLGLIPSASSSWLLRGSSSTAPTRRCGAARRRLSWA